MRLFRFSTLPHPLRRLRLRGIVYSNKCTPEIFRKIFPPPPEAPIEAGEEAEIQAHYSGYLNRQEDQVRRLSKLENVKIPEDFDFSSIVTLTREVREKLTKIRPRSLGQAARIPGMTPAALGILDIHISRIHRK